MFKNIIILTSLVLFVGCGMDKKVFNENISKNKFIGIENSVELKKVDEDVVEGLCKGLTESSITNRDNHNLIMNKNMVCVIYDKNKKRKD